MRDSSYFSCLKNKKLKKEKEGKRSKIVENIENNSLIEKGHFEGEISREELAYQAHQKKRIFRKKASKNTGIMLVLLVIIGTVFVMYLKNNKAKQSVSVKQQVQVEIPQDQDHIFINDVSGVSVGNKDDVKTTSDDAVEVAGKSENFRIRDIAIGGGNIVLAASNENLPLKVSDVRSETLTSKDGKKTQLLISWKTNKLAKSEIKYSKDGNGLEKNIKEDGYGFSHALAISSLEQSTRYTFAVVVSDRGGSISTSDKLAVYTGTKPVSVIDLISNQLTDIFGWALKKNDYLK
jgi:hypothetical protein